jgi:hypothetical protein
MAQSFADITEDQIVELSANEIELVSGGAFSLEHAN